MQRICEKNNKGAVELLKGYSEYVIPDKRGEYKILFSPTSSTSSFQKGYVSQA